MDSQTHVSYKNPFRLSRTSTGLTTGWLTHAANMYAVVSQLRSCSLPNSDEIFGPAAKTSVVSALPINSPREDALDQVENKKSVVSTRAGIPSKRTDITLAMLAVLCEIVLSGLLC
jgi:hypothetical protein